MKQHTNLIFLTGFSGSGKSTIGPLLANSLGYSFLDIDQCIEQKCGKTITQIFAEEGELAFRSIEKTILEESCTHRDQVVSLGGGVLDNDESFTLIRKHGILIYLKSPIKTLVKRLCHKSDRPLLRGPNGEKLTREEIEKKISSIFNRRKGRYETADITVQTDTQRIGSTVEELTRKVQRYQRRHTASST